MKYLTSKSSAEVNREKGMKKWKDKVLKQQQFHEEISSHIKQIFAEKKIKELEPRPATE